MAKSRKWLPFSAQMQVQVYDWRWGNEQEWVIRAVANGALGHKKLNWGTPLSAKLVSKPSCRGLVREGQYFPCPHQESGRSVCAACRASEGNFVYTIFDGFDRSRLTDEELEKINHPHWVYLAWFAPGMIKVGVSGASRKSLRQWEQGSMATLYLAQAPDGIIARQIETLFNKQGLRDKFQTRQKEGALGTAFEESQAESELKAALDLHQAALSDYPHLKKHLLPDPEFKFWPELYHQQELINNPWERLTLEPEESVSGEVIMVKGNFLGLRTPEEIVVVSLRDWHGCQVDFSPLPAGLVRHNPSQTKLF